MAMNFKLQSVGKWVIIMGIFIIIMIGWLICLSLADYSWDANSNAGIIVAVFGILVTVLVGYQIYNAIEIKDELRQNVIDMRSEMQERLKTMNDDMQGRLKTMNDEMQGRLKSMDDEMQGRLKSINDEMQGRLKTMNDEMQRRLKTMDDEMQWRLKTMDDEMQRHSEKIYELKKGYDKLIEEAQKEIRLNRNLSNAMLEYFHSEYWDKEKQLVAEYLSLATTIKFLFLSELERFGIKEEERLLDLCFARLVACIGRIKDSKDPKIIKSYVATSGDINRISKELTDIVKDPSYNTSAFYRDSMNKINAARAQIMQDFMDSEE